MGYWLKTMKDKIIKLIYKYLSPHHRTGRCLFANNSIRLGSHTFINYPSKMKVGDDVFIGNFNTIDSSVSIKIGKGTQITNYITILNHSSHNAVSLLKDSYKDPKKQSQEIGQGEVLIGEYCFIGPYSCIMPNSKIGSGCIVKAYSYINGSFPDNVLIGGNPAKVLKKLDEK